MTTPIGRYSKLKQPADFPEAFQMSQQCRMLLKADNIFVFPTDKPSCDKNMMLAEAGEFYISIAKSLREIFKIPNKEPIFVMRSSLPLRKMYEITRDFIGDPPKFVQTPLESPAPSTAQQVFENALLEFSTEIHGFAVILFSTPDHHYIPLFFDAFSHARDWPSLVSMEQLEALAPVPPLVCRAFEERIIPQNPDNPAEPFYICANWLCKKSRVKLPDLRFMRCAGCHQLYYCSVDCQKADWPRHKRYCEFIRAHPPPAAAGASAAQATKPAASPAPVATSSPASTSTRTGQQQRHAGARLMLAPEDLTDCSLGRIVAHTEDVTVAIPEHAASATAPAEASAVNASPSS